MIWSNIMFAKPLRRLQKHYFRSSYRERLIGILFFTLQVPLRSRFRARNGNECGRYAAGTLIKPRPKARRRSSRFSLMATVCRCPNTLRHLGAALVSAAQLRRVGCAEAFFCEFEPSSRASSSCFSQCGPAAAGHFRTILRPLDV